MAEKTSNCPYGRKSTREQREWFNRFVLYKAAINYHKRQYEYWRKVRERLEALKAQQDGGDDSAG